MTMGDHHQGGASNMQASASRKKAGSAAFPSSGVSAIKFGLLCTEDIVKLSVQSLQRHQQIGDPCLGLPHSQGDSCSSCGGTTPDDCPGHFGHLDLASPVYNPGHIKKLCRILKGVCLCCGKRKTKNRAAVLTDLKTNLIPHKDIGQRTGIQKSKAKKEPRDSTYVIISDDDEEPQHVLNENDQIFIDLAADLDADNKDFVQTQANGGCCKYCSKQYPYPDVKVVPKPIKNECIECVSLEYPGKGDMPPDYWKLMELGASRETSRTWDLLPSQALALLRRIPANVMGLDEPGTFILEAFPVPPNCLRPSANTVSVSAYKDLVERDNGTTRLLKQLVEKNTLMKSARCGKPSFQAGASESEELQLHISRYMRFKGAEKVKGSAEPVVKGSLSSTSNLSAIWKNRMKDSVLGKRTHQCAYANLTGDPNLPIEELAIPQEIAQQMTIPESVSVHNYDRLQAFTGSFKLEDARAGFVERDSNLYDLSANDSRKLELGDIVHRHLQEGDFCYANRTPSLHKHSVMAFKVKIHPEWTMKINPLVCSPFGADFDGDRLDIFLPQSLQARVETEELLALRKQVISSQNGDMLIGLSQDCLIAAYILTSEYIFFNALEMNQLKIHSHSQCDKALPPPAIIKSQRGAFWTGLQAYTLLLPSTLTFSTEGLLAIDGELLQADATPTWLRSSTRSLLYAIHEQVGVAAAIDYLNSCSMMLTELLLLEGFSIGLEDFSFREDPGFCSEIGNIIQSAKAYASISNFQAAQLDVEQLIQRHMKKGNAVGLMMNTGSKGSLSHLRQHVGCLGLQLYKKNEDCQFIEQTFWDGLNPSSFFHHSTSSRDHILRQTLQLSEPGSLRENLIKHLADAYIAYDGTVRYRNNQQVIRFNYRGGEASHPKDDSFEGESVGVLAATAISQQASQTVLSAPQKASKYIDFFKETLQSNYKATPKELKESDRTVILRLKKCSAEDCRCLESRLLELQHHLQRVTLKELTTNVVIEWTSVGESPWLCHMHLSNKALQHFNLAVESISHSLEKYLEENKGKKDWDSSICVLVSYSFCQALNGVGTSPCIHFLYYESETISEDVEYNDGIADSLKKLREKLIPRLLEVSITGNSFIESTSIVSEETTLIPSTEKDAEPVLKIVIETKHRGMAYEMIKEACGAISDYIDWTRSSPLSVQEIFKAFGVEAAYQCILQRLVCIMKELGVSLDDAYLTLIAEFATHTGNVLGFTAPGLNEFLKSIEASAPFLQAALKEPLKKLKTAAENVSLDPLEGVVASAMWGKRPSIGTASFKLIWTEKEVEDSTLDLLDKLDVHEFLTCVPDDRHERPGSPETVEDIDIETCESPFIDRNYKGDDTFPEPAWGSGTNDDNGWGEVSTGCDSGQGTMETQASGWGVQATTGNQWGTQPGTPERSQTENEGGSLPESQLLSDSGLGTEVENQNQESGWVMEQESSKTCDDIEVQTSQARTEGSVRNIWRKSEQADAEEKGGERRKKPFTPTGANTIPLGKNRFGLQFSGEVPPTCSGNESAWNEKLKEQEIPDGGWDATSGVHEEKGWGTPSQDQEIGWGEQTPRDGRSGWDDGPAVSDKGTTSNIKDGNRPYARNREPNETVSGPRKNMDPTKRKFNMEMYRLVRTVQQIFHSYQNGDRLSEDHETFVTENVLAHHPESERKIGVGVDFIKVDHPPDFPDNTCLFVVRKDGSAEDFSYHKCLRKFVEKTYPPEYSSLYDEQFNPKYKRKAVEEAKDVIQKVDGEPTQNSVIDHSLCSKISALAIVKPT